MFLDTRVSLVEWRCFVAFGFFAGLCLAAEFVLWFLNKSSGFGAGTPMEIFGMLCVWFFFIRGIYLWKTGRIIHPRINP